MKSTTKIIQVSDTIHGSISISDLEKRIISTRIFSRLHNISQNSTAYLTYPTNRTRRFEHSIGTMHLCGQMLVFSINNSDEVTIKAFFDEFELELNNIIDSKLIMDGESFGNPIYRDKLHDNNLKKQVLKSYSNINIWDYIYKLNIPKTVYDINKEVLFCILYQSIRLAGMLHDVGHPPMSHITEYAITGIWDEIKDAQNKTEREKEFIECINSYAQDPTREFQLHEEIGNKLTKRLLEYSVKKVNIPDDVEQVKDTLFELLVMDVTTSILQEKKPFFEWLHRIIDGSLDCDRLDYVSRDALNSGLESGKIEYGRLLSSMRLIHYDDSYWICPHIKMIDIIDDFYYRRWSLYKKIIFHHRVVKTDYLMENCIYNISRDYLNHILEKDKIENDSEKVIPYDISGIWKAIKQQPSYNEFFDRVLQWDDEWLLTILRKHYYGSSKEHKDNYTYYKIEELISNKKYFYSLLKKDADAIHLDKSITEKLNKDIPIIEDYLQKLRKKDTNVDGENTVQVNVDPFIDNIKRFTKMVNIRSNADSGNGNYILSIFRFELSAFLGSDIGFSDIIANALDSVLKDDKNIADYFFAVKKVTTGINKNLLIYSESNNGEIKIHQYNQISDTNNVLEIRRNSLIPIYIYIRKANENINLEFEKIISNLGFFIGENIIGAICKKIESLS